MGKNKLRRFVVNESRDNVIQAGKPLYTNIKGQWKSVYFKNENPITIELGCGNGEYSVGLAAHYPHKNFIGIDIKGARIFQGSTAAIANGLENVAFLRTKIDYIHEFFEPLEIDEIWITFPDPQPKEEKKRLTHPRFLNKYRPFLKPGGHIHLKTDSVELFDYTLEILAGQPINNLVYTHDLYQSAFLDEHKGIQTKYERIFLAEGKKINYLRFQLMGDIAN